MTPGAIKARQRRNEEKESAVFNDTLKEYIECKYFDIFKEFGDFYQKLKTEYPNKAKYTNTRVFRLWRKRMIKESFKAAGVEVISIADKHDIERAEQVITGSEVSDDNNRIDEQSEATSDDDRVVAASDSEATSDDDRVETASDNILAMACENLDININEANNEVEQIIAELENRGIQLDANEDEGVQMEPEDEIFPEPFDYRLEVELESW